jgi:hypothetical protein
LENFHTYINYEVCIIEKVNQQIANLNQISAQLSSLNEGSNNQAITQSFQETIAKSKSNIELNGQIEPCFTGEYQKFLTPEVKQAISEDKKFYEDFNAASTQIIEGINENNTGKLEAGSTKIKEVSSKPSSLFTSTPFIESVDKPLGELNNQSQVLETKQQEIDDYLSKLKRKYPILA